MTHPLRLALVPALLIAAMSLSFAALANPGNSASRSEPAIDTAMDALADGDYKKAARYLKRHLRRDRNDVDALNLMGYSLRKLEKFEDSEEYYLWALEIEPAHLGANEYLGELYLQTNRPELARERLAVLEKACPGACEERDELREAVAKYAQKNGP